MRKIQRQLPEFTMLAQCTSRNRDDSPHGRQERVTDESRLEGVQEGLPHDIILDPFPVWT
jgi:hypothetical protein